MFCGNCGEETTHIKVRGGREYCPSCSYLKENRKTDDLMTRNRVRMDSLKFEGDMQPPQKWDKVLKKVVPNEEFIKLNGTRAKNFFSQKQLDEAGYSKLGKSIIKAVKEEKAEAAKVKEDVEFHGNADDRVKELLKTDWKTEWKK
jgi:hypothetical protein